MHVTYNASLLNEFFASRMADEGYGWLYGGWKKSGAHTTEWRNRTKEFIDCAFSVPPDQGVKCHATYIEMLFMRTRGS
jgi:hypothetical protein